MGNVLTIRPDLSTLNYGSFIYRSYFYIRRGAVSVRVVGVEDAVVIRRQPARPDNAIAPADHSPSLIVTHLVSPRWFSHEPHARDY
jgi:hypothetical protein